MNATSEPMFLHRLLRPSIARRLASWVLLGSVCVLAPSLVFLLWGALKVVQQHTGESMAALANSSANAIAARTSSVDMTARIVAAAIGRRLDNPEFIENLLVEMVLAHPDIDGVSAAFEPYAVADKGKFYAPFFFQQNNVTTRRDLAEAPAPYRETDWYKHGIACEHGCWGEVFHSESRNQVMINYGVPVRDSTKRVIGMVNVDVQQRWLQSIAEGTRPRTSVIAFLLNESGQMLAASVPKYVGTSIFDLAIDTHTPEYAEMARRMLAGETGSVEYVSPLVGEPVRAFFTPIPGSRWSLSIVVPRDVYIRDSRNVFLKGVAIGLAGLAALGLFVWLAVRRLLAPLKQLAANADHIARGELDFRLDAPLHADEVGMLTQSFVRMRDELRQHIGELTEATVARQRLQSELEIAQRIQESMLPRNHYIGVGAYPFELRAMQRPARVVGGDLYSYYVSDDAGRLCFLIGDVSGKGIPAALFMARTITKANLRIAAAEQPEQLLAELNTDLCARNEDSMFVTLLCGILDLATGRLMLASAGHDAPIRVGNGRARNIEVETSPPLGLYPDTIFIGSEAQLEPDECVVMYTDGVTEALDPSDAFYGEQRLLDTLARCNGQTDSAVAAVVADVAAFTRAAPQADDMTVLVLHWHGVPSPKSSLTIEIGAQLAEVASVLDRVEEWLSGRRTINMELLGDVRVALEELLVNALNYGFPQGVEGARLRTVLTLESDVLNVEFTDNGIAYDPFAAPAPDLDVDHDDREPGGLGVFLVTQLASEYHYRREGDRNCVSLRFIAPPIPQPGESTHGPASPD
ncbi:MAG TPA: SpoIIE family protein phosphatase [Rhodanobacteraceae bacterium]|nr:SpoIIE family protein phosphatase [Rhodanobacteraceae bacterium]